MKNPKPGRRGEAGNWRSSGRGGARQRWAGPRGRGELGSIGLGWVAGVQQQGPGRMAQCCVRLVLIRPDLLFSPLLACPSNHLSAMRPSPPAYGPSALFFLLPPAAPPMTCYGLTRPWRACFAVALASQICGWRVWHSRSITSDTIPPITSTPTSHHPPPFQAASRASCFLFASCKGGRYFIRYEVQPDAVQQHLPQNMQPRNRP